MSSRTGLKEVDWLLVATVLLITVIGITFIWSASHGPDGRSRQASRQIGWAVVALCVSVAILSVSYLRFGRYAYVIYAVCVICLVVALMSAPRRETRRWIRIGPVTVQPSEFVKLGIVIALAQFLRYRNAGNAETLLLAIPIVAIPMALVLKQPDLGTALTMIPIAGAMLFVGGMSGRQAMVITMIGILMIPVAWFGMKDYQKKRILAFVRPEDTRLSSGYQVIQSVVAIGSGKVFGRGLSESRVRVPESTTDFIFSAVGEEWGFAGCTFLLALFMVLFASSLGIAVRTREPFGRLLVVGCVTTLAIQVFVNSAMTIQFAPITGLTLPMVSYGGSSLVNSYACIAVILNVGMRRVAVFDGL